MMEMLTLPHSEVKVSKVCLGTMNFGSQLSESESFTLLDLAIKEYGINFIDTAELYPVPHRKDTFGRTDEIIGRWFACNPGWKDRVVVSTKVIAYAESMDWIRGGPRPNINQFFKCVEDSLRRLQRDYIDVFQIHWPARNTPLFGSTIFQPEMDQRRYEIVQKRVNQLSEEDKKRLKIFSQEDLDDYCVTQRIEAQGLNFYEQIDAIFELKEKRKIRSWGLSNENTWGVMKFIEWCNQSHVLSKPSVIQNAYHLLNRTFETDLWECCYRENIQLYPYSPLAGGWLTGKYHGPSGIPQGSRLDVSPELGRRYPDQKVRIPVSEYIQLAKKYDISSTEMALSFVYHRPFVSSTIIGVSTPEQLKENVAAYGTTLSQQIVRDINRIHCMYPNPTP